MLLLPLLGHRSARACAIQRKISVAMCCCWISRTAPQASGRVYFHGLAKRLAAFAFSSAVICLIYSHQPNLVLTLERSSYTIAEEIITVTNRK